MGGIEGALITKNILEGEGALKWGMPNFGAKRSNTSLVNESLINKFVGFNRTLVGLLIRISHVFPSPYMVQMIRVGKIHKM